MAEYPTPPTSTPERRSAKLPAQDSYFLSSQEQKTPVPRQNTSPPLGSSKPRPGSGYSSPVYRVSSPQNAHGRRAQPRTGFVNRMLGKLRRFIKSITAYGRKFPVAMGLLTMLPVIVGATLFRIIKGLMGFAKGKTMAPNFNLGRSKTFESLKGSSGSDGTKAGPFDALLRILHKLLNNLREVAPRSVSRMSNLFKFIS